MVSKKSSGKTASKTKASKGRKQRASQNRSNSSASSRKAGGSGFFSKWRFLSWIASLGFMFALIGLVILAWFSTGLPDVDDLRTYDKPAGIRIYDSKNNLIGSYGHVMGKYVNYADIPKPMIDALIATEDRRFFEHQGVDPFGIARAMYHNFKAGGVVQGGSTITQQLAKNAFLTPERTYKRKIQEVMLSLWIEGHFTKEEIIEIYLNRVYLGGGNYGIDAASHFYFDQSAQDLSIQESALLVGLLKAPSRYAPTRDKELSFKRTQQVVLNMLDAGVINEQQAKNAISKFDETIILKEEVGKGYRYFADYVVDQLPEYIGAAKGDLKIITTLNPNLQEAAEKSVTKWMNSRGYKQKATQASALTMTSDGAIAAMVGGVDYQKSQYNRVTQAKRQPGSAFKIYVYLAAIEAGYTPNSWVVDKPVRYGKWRPQNYNKRFRGEMKLREAYFRSVNTISAQLTRQLGVSKVINTAHKIGVKSDIRKELSISLGTSELTMLELVNGFAYMANEGYKVEPYAIKEISLQSGKVIYKRERAKRTKPVIRTSVVNMMNDMMIDAVNHGTAKSANFGRPSAGKTGTTQDFRDAWYVGYTPQYVTGVWIGNDNYKPTLNISGGSLPTNIYKDIMRSAHRGLAVKSLPQRYQYVVQRSTQPEESLPWLQPQTGPVQGEVVDGVYTTRPAVQPRASRPALNMDGTPAKRAPSQIYRTAPSYGTATNPPIQAPVKRSGSTYSDRAAEQPPKEPIAKEAPRPFRRNKSPLSDWMDNRFE